MKPGVEEGQNWLNHRIRITLTSLNVRSLEKGNILKTLHQINVFA